MDHPTIEKRARDKRQPPQLQKYEALRKSFSWAQVEKELDWVPGGGLNIAHECIDRHCEGKRGDVTAMVWVGKNGEEERYTYEQMRVEINKCANALTSLGMRKGDRVFVFLDRLPETYFTILGTLKAGGVVGPLFSAFGPDPVRDRLQDSGATILVTTPELRKRIAAILPQCAELQHIVIVNKLGRSKEPLVQGDVPYDALVAKASAEFTATTTRDDYSIMHYTSGTTGKPKGAVHRHNSVLQQYVTGKWCLDLRPDDIYWCTADPGWVTGTSYGMIAPWSNGVTQLVYEGGFKATVWYELIAKYKVTVWYTAPTAIRMMMKIGVEAAKRRDTKSLRFIASVGEPLNPEGIFFGQEAFDLPFHDNWWQTETGGIMVANYAEAPIKPGSMGRPIPGVEVAIVDDKGKTVSPGTVGNLAVKPGWPSMFQTYWRNEAMYKSKFKDGWYITGDRAHMDADGYFWFVGRADDVINTAGHLVGPFEVESALVEHPAVAEAGVIGKPDPIAMEVVKAFVSLREGYEPTEELRRELLRFARGKLSAGVAPREIDFLPSLPKTRSGKIMRRLLKARELGLPEGDTSTLEED
ncbi:MAG: acetate--CoA ligase [Dehalococcoidia bacterium]|nr:acetate--CoA ligase [Dehalococcoidia bacterium]